MNQPMWITELTPEQVGAYRDASPGGVLAGLRFAIKDNIDLAGVPSTAACPALDKPASSTATAVSRLLNTGAIPVGKTNMDQFATGLVGTRSPYGACHSVASPAHVSGGSSSGSAVAVATGAADLALGTDTAGSGRVPAAFNGIVGMKPTRGLVSASGVLPACRSLDCVTTFTKTVDDARSALSVLAAGDPADVWSRPRPPLAPPGVARRMRVVGVPVRDLDLDPEHASAWARAVEHAHGVAAHVVPVDIEPFLAAGRLLYEGPWVAERWAGFGHLLEPDGPHLDPAVREIVTAGRDLRAADAFAAADRLAALRRASEAIWHDIDALLLPVTPGHPTLAEVAADPIGVNARVGTYTTFANLLDLCAIAVPAGVRDDGLPFGVQLIAPAFADEPLLDLASVWTGSPHPYGSMAPGWTQVAVVGAHLSGMPLHPQLARLGARLAYRARTGGGYRLFQLPDGVRPALTYTGDGPAGGIAVEVFDVPHQGIGALLDTIPSPLGLGRVKLDDGLEVTGFLAESARLGGAIDVSALGGWRAASPALS
jgi:allophanate hydrolase